VDGSLHVMSSAEWGLLGVVVGGMITSVWSWLALIRQDLSDAVVAARLVEEDLCSVPAGEGVPLDPKTWALNRAALAKALGYRQWQAVSDLYGKQEASRSSREVEQARAALKPLVRGKRYLVLQRWRNMLTR
jgi:hypothetical protein